jgi:hypothetical protein
MRPTAGNAALRPAQKLSRSCSDCEMRQVVEPLPRRSPRRPDQMVDLDAGTIELDDQQRLDIERIAGMDEIFGRVDRRAVHHLHAAGNDAGADDVGDALAALLAGRKADQQGARRLRLLAGCAR